MTLYRGRGHDGAFYDSRLDHLASHVFDRRFGLEDGGMTDLQNLLREAADWLNCDSHPHSEELAAGLRAAAESMHWAQSHPGLADQYRQEALSCRVELGFAEDSVVSPRELQDAISRLIKAPESLGEPVAWMPIETAPHSQPVLIHYKNGCGMGRTIRAEFIPANTIEANGEYDDHCEYNEALDNYFWPEGWHEMIDNWGEYSHVAVNETPTHWMPLPEPPAGDSHHE
jgi:hypothetical protein